MTTGNRGECELSVPMCFKCLGQSPYTCAHPTHFKPWFKNAYSPHCSSYSSYGTSKENLSKNGEILSLVITSFILITWMFEQVVIIL